MVPREAHGGRAVYSRKVVDGVSQFLDRRGGDNSGVRSASTGFRQVAMPERLAALMATIPSTHNVWAVSLGGIPDLHLPERSNFRNLAKAFSAIKTATASADLSSGLQLAIVANYTGEAEAKQVHGALRGLLGLARLSAPRD
jgi:hypothetical protein